MRAWYGSASLVLGRTLAMPKRGRVYDGLPEAEKTYHWMRAGCEVAGD